MSTLIDSRALGYPIKAVSGYWDWGYSIGQSWAIDIYLFSVAIRWRVTGSQPDCRLFGISTPIAFDSEIFTIFTLTVYLFHPVRYQLPGF